MESALPQGKQRHSVTFTPSSRSLRPSKSSSDLSVVEIDPSLGASTSTKADHKRGDSGDGHFFSFETTAVRTPSIRSLASDRGKGKAPALEITPPPGAHFPRPRASHSTSSRLSSHSEADSDASSDDLFYPRRSGSAPLSDVPHAAPFYQQAKNGGKVHSSPNLLLGPLLTDYYKSGPAGFQPAAASTPDTSPFTLRPPAHPSSIPVPRAARPLFYVERVDPPPTAAGPSTIPEHIPRKVPSFSSLRKWLPGQTDQSDGHLDVERLSEDSPSLAERERSVSLGKKAEQSRLEALKRVSEAARIPLFAPAPASPLFTPSVPDVFSADPSAPSFCPSPSPPPAVAPSNRSTASLSSFASRSSVYATPSASRPDLAESSLAFPTEADKPREDPPWILTPPTQTPTPPSRRAAHHLLRRPPQLSVIEGSPLSSKGGPGTRTPPEGEDRAPTPTPRNVAEPRSQPALFGSPPESPTMFQEEDLVPPPKFVDEDDNRTDVTSTRRATTSWGSGATVVGRRSHGSSFQNLFRWSKQGSLAESSTTAPGMRMRTKSEIADEEFASRSSTPDSKELRLKHRRHWSSKGDEDDVITFRSPMSPMTPTSDDGLLPRSSREGKQRVRDSLSISSPRELILPSMVAARKSDDRRSSLFQAPLSPVSPDLPPPPRPPPAPPLTPLNKERRVRILSGPHRRSSVFAGKQRPLLLAHSAQQVEAEAASPSTLSSIFEHSGRATHLPAATIIRHPLIAIDALLPAQSMFILGFLLGPWAWLIGGYLLSPDGFVPSRDREGAVSDRLQIARPRPSTSPAASIHDDHDRPSFGGASTSSRPLRPYERDVAALSTAELMHHPLARNPSVMPTSRQLAIARVRTSLRSLSLAPDAPCDWVWRCRAAAVTSGAVIVVGLVLAIIAAVRGHL